VNKYIKYSVYHVTDLANEIVQKPHLHLDFIVNLIYTLVRFIKGSVYTDLTVVRDFGQKFFFSSLCLLEHFIGHGGAYLSFYTWNLFELKRFRG
jgi:hypothetical protein